MFKLMRRVSGAFFPRPDRPWEDDATSQAPRIGRKRRLSTFEREESPGATKRAREMNDEGENDASDEDTPASALPTKETKEVKEVTKGVKEVELEDKKDTREGIEDDVSEEEDDTSSSDEQDDAEAVGLSQTVDEIGNDFVQVNAEDVPLPEGEDDELEESLPTKKTTSSTGQPEPASEDSHPTVPQTKKATRSGGMKAPKKLSSTIPA